MVNICGKCKYYTRSETDKEGNFHHYCSKPYERIGPQAEGETVEIPDLRLRFNDEICEHYEKRKK